jgi:hypothetical protein
MHILDTNSNRPRRAHRPSLARLHRGDHPRQTAPAHRPAALSAGELRAEILAVIG